MEAVGGIGAGGEESFQRHRGQRTGAAGGGALLELLPGLPREPFVFVGEERDQSGVVEFGDIMHLGLGRLAVGDFVNAAAGAVDAVVVVAFADVGPVDEEDAAVGAVGEVEAAEPRVGGGEKIGGVLADVAGAVAFEEVRVHAAAVQVHGENGAAIFIGPVVALIDHQPAVGVAAAGERGGVGDALGADVAPFFPGVPVEMVGVLFEKTVGVRVERLAEHAAVVRAGDDVPEVADDGVDEEGFAVLVPVHAPGIGGAVGDRLEDFADGMIAPDAAVHFRAFGFGRAGFADGGGAGDAVAGVEPAVGAPLEAVGDVVADAVGLEAVEEDDGFAVGHVVAVAVGEEEEIRRAEREDAAEAEFDAGEKLRAVPEDGAFVEAAVVVGVLENDDAVADGAVEADLGFGVGVVLGDPEAAAGIPGHRDGILHVGFGGEEGGLETGRELQQFQRVERGREGLVVGGLGVEEFGEGWGRGGGGGGSGEVEGLNREE